MSSMSKVFHRFKTNNDSFESRLRQRREITDEELVSYLSEYREVENALAQLAKLPAEEGTQKGSSKTSGKSKS